MGDMRFTQRVLALLLVLSLFLAVPAQAQGSTSKYFDETKHNVSGAFWTYYQSLPNAQTLFGFPITESFTNREGVTVQYFQRARLELQGGQAIVTPLGALTYRSVQPITINNPLACRSFAESPHAVCFAFLDFFENNGDIAQFGYPISPFEYQDGIIVQYFQKARFEWRPSNPSGKRVVLSELGSIYFDSVGEDRARLDPVEPLNAGIAPRVLTLNVRAFPWKAVTNSTDQQYIFVIVQDQTLEAVPNATGHALIHWAAGSPQTVHFTTDSSGIATLAFPVNNQPQSGFINVEVFVSHGDLLGETSTSFRIWY